MFGKFNRKKLNVKIKHIISAGAELAGGLSFTDGMHVNGIVRGPVTAAGNDSSVLIGPDGRIEGAVVSETVMVAGSIEGDIRCVHLILKNGANVTGNILAASLEIEKGAQIRGACECQPDYNPFSIIVPPAANDHQAITLPLTAVN